MLLERIVVVPSSDVPLRLDAAQPHELRLGVGEVLLERIVVVPSSDVPLRLQVDHTVQLAT